MARPGDGARRARSASRSASCSGPCPGRPCRPALGYLMVFSDASCSATTATSPRPRVARGSAPGPVVRIFPAAEGCSAVACDPVLIGLADSPDRVKRRFVTGSWPATRLPQSASLLQPPQSVVPLLAPGCVGRLPGILDPSAFIGQSRTAAKPRARPALERAATSTPQVCRFRTRARKRPPCLAWKHPARPGLGPARRTL